MDVSKCEFSVAHYREIQVAAREYGYRFVTFAEVAGGVRFDSPTVLLRHDVDLDLRSAVRMARAEQRRGVRSTFFIRVAAGRYNALGKDGVGAVRELIALGHEVGLHAEPMGGRMNEDVLRTERRILEFALEASVVGVSLHMPRRNASLDQLWTECGFVYEAGSAVFNAGRQFFSDSSHRWRPHCVCGALGNRGDVYVTIHPEWWFGRLSAERALAELRRGG